MEVGERAGGAVEAMASRAFMAMASCAFIGCWVVASAGFVGVGRGEGEGMAGSRTKEIVGEGIPTRGAGRGRPDRGPGRACRSWGWWADECA